MILEVAVYLSHELRRCIETRDRYLLLVRWEKLEDHTEGFRGSPLFQQWRAVIGPFFERAPAVEHYEATAAAARI